MRRVVTLSCALALVVGACVQEEVEPVGSQSQAAKPGDTFMESDGPVITKEPPGKPPNVPPIIIRPERFPAYPLPDAELVYRAAQSVERHFGFTPSVEGAEVVGAEEVDGYIDSLPPMSPSGQLTPKVEGAIRPLVLSGVATGVIIPDVVSTLCSVRKDVLFVSFPSGYPNPLGSGIGGFLLHDSCKDPPAGSGATCECPCDCNNRNANPCWPKVTCSGFLESTEDPSCQCSCTFTCSPGSVNSCIPC